MTQKEYFDRLQKEQNIKLAIQINKIIKELNKPNPYSVFFEFAKQNIEEYLPKIESAIFK